MLLPARLNRLQLARTLALIVAAALGLGGCASRLEAVEQIIAPETNILISAKAAGGLDASVPYQASAITARVPGLSADTVLVGLEDQTASLLVLFKSGFGGRTQALQIVPGPDGRISEVHGVARFIQGPAGERPGMRFADAAPDIAGCRPGRSLWIGTAVCPSRAAANVLLVFSLPGSAAASPTLPDLAVMRAGELQRVIWTPPVLDTLPLDPQSPSIGQPNQPPATAPAP
jgi:hypothetical protein